MCLHVDWGLSHLGWALLVAQLQTAGVQVSQVVTFGDADLSFPSGPDLDAFPCSSTPPWISR